jgi:hypothetical protein
MSTKFDTLFEAIYTNINGGAVIAPGASLEDPNSLNSPLVPILRYTAINHGRELKALNNQPAGPQTIQSYKNFWQKVLEEYGKIGQTAAKLIADLSQAYKQPLEDVLANYVVNLIDKGDGDYQAAFTTRDNESMDNIHLYDTENQKLPPDKKDSFSKYLSKVQANVHGAAQPGTTSQDKAKQSLESEIDRINPSRYRSDKHQGYGK